MPETPAWTPYPHEEVRVSLLWRKRILLGLILGLIFALWASSLGVQTDTSEELTLYGGDGSSVTVNRPEERATQPAATVSLQPGETARIGEDITLTDEETQAGDRGSSIPERPEGTPFLGLLLLIGPFLLALLIWRYLGNQGASTEVNYGIYKGSLPLELLSATHAHLVQTSRRVDQNPFGKARTDYVRDTEQSPLFTGPVIEQAHDPETALEA